MIVRINIGFTCPIFNLLSQERAWGMGIPDLRNLNMYLLASWIQMYQLVRMFGFT
jgi:hypothetical protein